MTALEKLITANTKTARIAELCNSTPLVIDVCRQLDPDRKGLTVLDLALIAHFMELRLLIKKDEIALIKHVEGWGDKIIILSINDDLTTYHVPQGIPAWRIGEKK